MTLEDIELRAIRSALTRHDGNVVTTAAELGVSRSALYRRMEKFGL
jgi:transcriptional regulator of acetoin/glycerol metabolism